MLIDIKMKISVAELGHNGRLKFTSTLKKLHQSWHLSPFLQNGYVYLAEIMYGVPAGP